MTIDSIIAYFLGGGLTMIVLYIVTSWFDEVLAHDAAESFAKFLVISTLAFVAYGSWEYALTWI
jgi:hypothetical protein